jgi:hypothetical protein
MARQWATITLKDAFGRQTRIIREMDDQVDLTSYLNELTGFVGKLLDVSDLGVVSTEFRITGNDNATSPAAGANVDVGATFVGWGTGENAGRKIVTKVPGFPLAKVDADGSIDLDDLEVAAYLEEFTSAGDWMLSDGEKVSSWISGTLDK